MFMSGREWTAVTALSVGLTYLVYDMADATCAPRWFVTLTGIGLYAAVFTAYLYGRAIVRAVRIMRGG